MRNNRRALRPSPTAEVVDFDEARLDLMAPEARAEVFTEAAMLAQAFAPDLDIAKLERLHEALVNGMPPSADYGPARGRLLAVALKRLAWKP